VVGGGIGNLDGRIANKTYIKNNKTNEPNYKTNERMIYHSSQDCLI
jgi:hypothetical protein